MKTHKVSSKNKRRGRNHIPFNDPIDRLHILLTIGSQNPPLKLKDFIQRIRLHEDRKMSYEYKICKKLCPAYGKTKDPTINKVYPYERLCNDKDARHLWTKALVKIVLDQRTETDYQKKKQQYQNAERDYNSAISEQSSAQKVKEKEERYDLARKNYLKVVDVVNSKHPKDLCICLTFRGLLTFLYGIYEYRVERIESKKGKQDAEKKEKEEEMKRRKELLKGLREKIYKVIRNPYVIKDVPFLADSELHESLGFNVVGTLLDIGAELIGQLHIDANRDQYLLARATERYLAEFDSFFFVSHYDSAKNTFSFNIAFIQPVKGLPPTDGQVAAEKAMVIRLNTYRRNRAKIMKTWKLGELNELDALVHQSSMMDHSFKQEHNDFDPSTGGGAAMIFSVPREDEAE